MSDVAQMLDRTFLTIGGARVTLGGLLLLVLIAAATLLASWILHWIVHLDPAALNAIRRKPAES